MENPSKRWANSSASITLDGIAAILYTCRPFSPRTRPCSAITASTRSASSRVRQQGIMTMIDGIDVIFDQQQAHTSYEGVAVCIRTWREIRCRSGHALWLSSQFET
jgi:hypothetical protein